MRKIFFALLLAVGCARPGLAAPPVTNQWSTAWTPLFDGQTLNHWAVTDFTEHGKASVEAGQIKIQAGTELSGVNWTNGSLPKTDYEISLQAVKLEGNDFFCGLTFPVSNAFCSLIVGGWGGSVVGLSSLDGNDASENETTHSMDFEKGHWYEVRVRVTPKKIEAWIDQKKIVDVSIVGHEVGVRPGSIYLSEPLGVATYETTAGLRDIKLRLIEH